MDKSEIDDGRFKASARKMYVYIGCFKASARKMYVCIGCTRFIQLT